MRLIPPTFFFSLLLLIAVYSPLLGSAELKDGSRLNIDPEEITAIMRNTAMPDVGKGRLAKILSRYYNEGLGGAENWEQIFSLKFSGTLKLEAGEFDLNAYQKKPNLTKMVIGSDGLDLILSYDGDVAWQHLPGRNTKPKLMEADEARRFIHGASFGSHLLYPFAEGKRILYLDTVPVDGHICHHIRVELDSGYEVDYFIDIRKYLEIKVVNRDLTNNSTSSVVYRNHARRLGMPIAMEVENYEEGEWVSSLILDEVKVNSGVIPFMFKMRP